MIKENTILGMNLFGDNLRDSLIFHIPHSKTKIPNQFKIDFVNNEITKEEIDLVTDFFVDEIFNINDVTKLIFPYSRIFCDVERLEDEYEVMFKKGRGFYYTKTDGGELLRENLNGNKAIIYNDYYLKHHKRLTKIVDQKIKNNGFALIIDCHSFNNIPIKSDIVQDKERPDFCLGIDKYHTPKWLIDMVSLFLIKQGYSIKINHPYAGTIVPQKYYHKNNNIYSIMIDINKSLYIIDGAVNHDNVIKLNQLFSNLFLIK